MQPVDKFKGQSQEFWALVKLASMLLGYSERGTGRLKRYEVADVEMALLARELDPTNHEESITLAVEYVNVRADLLHDLVEPNLMNRESAAEVYESLRERINPPEHLLGMNKQKGAKKHPAYLTGIVNMLTFETLQATHGDATYDSDPRGPLTFARDGMPLRTLFRRMDGAYPDVNHPFATWEIKEYYGTTTFGSRVADGVYETALDGYELNELRDVGVEVEHYLFVDDYFTWWECGRSYLCRIVDMLHSGLLDGAFFGREVVGGWPEIVSAWPSAADR